MEPASKAPTPVVTEIEQPTEQQLSPSKSVTSFKTHFFNLIRCKEDHEKIEKFLMENRKILTEKVISHMFVA